KSFGLNAVAIGRNSAHPAAFNLDLHNAGAGLNDDPARLRIAEHGSGQYRGVGGTIARDIESACDASQIHDWRHHSDFAWLQEMTFEPNRGGKSCLRFELFPSRRG